MTLTLSGYRYSVYTRAVRMVLAARGLHHAYHEIDPFDPAQAEEMRALHPFGRVPVLDDDAFRLWETQAILDYLDTLGSAPSLIPQGAPARARMRQVMGIADSYVYGSLVRQAVSHAIFLPPEDADSARAMTVIAAGLSGAPVVMAALDEIACEGLVLQPDVLTLADCHLWPMLDYVVMIPEGRDSLTRHDALRAWAAAMEAHPVARATRPDLDQLQQEHS